MTTVNAGTVIFSTVVGERNFGNMVNNVDYTVSGNTLRLNLDTRYIFDSFELKTGTVLTTLDNDKTVMYLECPSGEIKINGTINLNNILPNGRVTRSVTINGRTFNVPGVADGGLGYHQIKTGPSSVLGQFSTSSDGFGGGGGGNHFRTLDNFVFVSGNPGGGGTPFGTAGGSTTTTGSSVGSFNVDGNSAIGNSAGSGGWAHLRILARSGNVSSTSTGGAGGNSYGANGGDGNWSISTSGSWSATIAGLAYGGGGAGGIAGRPGLNLYIEAKVLRVSGTINTSGGAGGNGGNGGRSRTQNSNLSGSIFASSGGGYPGAGGGGAGGGDVTLHYYDFLVNTGTITRSGGSKGLSGLYYENSAGSPVVFSLIGEVKDGQNGTTGALNIIERRRRYRPQFFGAGI